MKNTKKNTPYLTTLLRKGPRTKLKDRRVSDDMYINVSPRFIEEESDGISPRFEEDDSDESPMF